MPELPDVEVYVEALRERVIPHRLERVAVYSPFLLRSAKPPIDAVHGRTAREARRIGKRIAIGFEGDLWLVLHLMIAGRLHWRTSAPKPGTKGLLAVFEFDSGFLTFTEAGSQHRAKMHVMEGQAGLDTLFAGGIEPLDADLAAFGEVLRSENHTLKRSLTDPRLFSGIGNAYSDEILHRAQLSPVALTSRMTADDIARLHAATQNVLREWVVRLRDDARGEFPEKVTAFRKDMTVHGRYGLPCLRCGTKIQRIRFASNETNYCPACQTGGKLLADRALSRLMREDWPKTLEELEVLKKR
jgi:formamidopyrimidine-DNA glycosylase